MTIEQLRSKHPKFSYNHYQYQINQNQLQIQFHFQIEPNLEFTPKLSLPITETQLPEIENLVFHLGIIEAVSYWKLSCSPEFHIAAGQLNQTQIDWWTDLITHGLGEFYYQNQIDFTQANFLKLTSNTSAKQHQPLPDTPTDGQLILVGGGKDSIVTLETLKNTPDKTNLLMLNPTIAAEKTAQVAGFNQPLIVDRQLDPKLLQLNQQGYLNGHTPFSAYLSFLSLLVAQLHGYKYIIASNEASAGEANLEYKNLAVNHQYSKSFRYEQRFADYQNQYLSQSSQYFSLLRPLSELQIAWLFTQTETYDSVFCSCNRSRNQYWCGQCPKCAFVYLLLSGLIPPDRRQLIFGDEDWFERPQIQTYIQALVGFGEHKPFECVGTETESQQAAILALDNYQNHNQRLPTFLSQLVEQIRSQQPINATKIRTQIHQDWETEHRLPEKYQQLLSQRILKWKLAKK